jgi:dTDP-glucose pyrophosphorylase
MQVVILAGGKGTRISEESLSRPKPMIELYLPIFCTTITKVTNREARDLNV